MLDHDSMSTEGIAQYNGSTDCEDVTYVQDIPPGKQNKNLGDKGEEAAALFLARKGYMIIERNWKCFAGEADIIALDDDYLVFVEVKTRRGIEKGFPEEAVGKSKRERYEKIALAYVQDNFFGEAAVRFDVISVVVLKHERAFIRHHRGAFSVE